MRTITAAILIGLALFAAACDGEKKSVKSVRDVKYFLAHPGERKSTIARCNNDPGELADAPECVNADKAAEEAMSISIQNALQNDSKK
jgi:hypothetical protein